MSFWSNDDPSTRDVIEALEHCENQGDIKDVLIRMRKLADIPDFKCPGCGDYLPLAGTCPTCGSTKSGTTEGP